MKLCLFAVSSIWKRDMLRLSRQKSRILFSLFSPIFLLAFLSLGFSKVDVLYEMNIDYLSYLAPGMMGMTLLSSANTTSLFLLWDRELGFLKEIMVTPISRQSIILGRSAVGITNSLIQSMILLLAGLVMGMKISGHLELLLSLPFIILIASTSIGMGLSLASFVKDTFSFNLALSFILYPLLFFSGAFYPVDRFPVYIVPLAHLNPLTYGIDGLRYSLLGISSFHPALDLGVMVISCIAMLSLGAYLFEICEVE